MKRVSDSIGGSALVVAVGDYDDDQAYVKLNYAPQAAKKLAHALEAKGYSLDYPELLNGGEKKDIIDSVDRWFREAREDDVLFFFWTGHGKSETEGHYLITKDSPGKGLNADVAFAASSLGAMVANSPTDKILVVLDTCYSGAGAADVANSLATMLATRMPKAGRSRAVAVIASAHPLKKAQEGWLCEALTKILTDPQTLRPWSDNDQRIRTTVLAEALEESLGSTLGYKCDGPRQEFVPNPRYRGTLPAIDMETRRRQLVMPDAEAHFLPACRGIEVGEMTGWYHTGRERLLTELVEWIETIEHGMAIVTGPAGSGKSAVMGRLAILSDPEYRALATKEETLPPKSASAPPVGSIDVAVHAKGKTLADCVLALKDGLGIDFPGEADASLDSSQLVNAFLDSISTDYPGRRFTFLVDALDEAPRGHPNAIGARLLKPLAELPGVRVLVGVRRNPNGSVLPESENRHERLRTLFGHHAIIYDLEDERDTEHDIADYVKKRLGVSRHAGEMAQIREVARAIAEHAAGIFLYARVVTRTLMDLERLDGPLPDSALAAFVSDLTYRFKDDKARVYDLLRALAWGEGKGLTRRAWAPVANALSSEGAMYDDNDITWALNHAGVHIVESGEDGQAVYRLTHQAFVDHFHTQHETVAAHRAIRRALTDGMSGVRWLDADGYLLRHLASHAAAAREIDKLFIDPAYLVVADPIRLSSELNKASVLCPDVEVEVYLHSVDRLKFAKSDGERASYLELTALQVGQDSFAARIRELCLQREWHPVWACRNRGHSERVLAREPWMIYALDVVDLNGDTYLVYGGAGGARVENLDTGHIVEMNGDVDVRSVAVAELRGQPVVIGGCNDGDVWVWDMETGDAVGRPFTAHANYTRALASFKYHDLTIVVSGGCDDNYCDGEIRIWNLESRREVAVPKLRAFGGTVQSITVGELDGRAIMIVAGDILKDKNVNTHRVNVWDVFSGSTVWTPEMKQKGLVRSIALGSRNGRFFVVGDSDSTLTIWSLDEKRQLYAMPEGPSPWVTSVVAVAAGEFDGSSVVAGAWGNSVRLFSFDNLLPLSPLSDFLEGHDDEITSMAFHTLFGRYALVTASKDGTVRAWFLDKLVNAKKPEIALSNTVSSLALARVRGESIVIAGGPGGLNMWNAESGTPKEMEIEPTDNARVCSLTTGEIDGVSVVVEGSSFGAIRAWDVRTYLRVGAGSNCENGSNVNSIVPAKWRGRPSFLAARGNGGIEVWDLGDGSMRRPPLVLCGYEEKAVEAVDTIAWGGRILAIGGGGDRHLSLWDIDEGALCCSIVQYDHVRAVRAREICGRELVVSSGDYRTVQLWLLSDREHSTSGQYSDDTRSKPWLKLRTEMHGHTNCVQAVEILERDGEPIIVSGGRDRILRVWQEDGELIMTVKLDSEIHDIAVAQPTDHVCIVTTNHGLLAINILPD